MTTHILFDTFNYHEENMEDIFYDDLAIVKDVITKLSKAKNGHTRNNFIMLSHRYSHYGAIGGNGAVGLRSVDSIDKLFSVGDDFQLRYDDETNKYTFVYFDHDGNDTADFIHVNSTKQNEISELIDEDYMAAKTKITELINAYSFPDVDKVLYKWVDKEGATQFSIM